MEKAKILIMFYAEPLTKLDEYIKTIEYLLEKYDLPHDSIVLSSGNYSMEALANSYLYAYDRAIAASWHDDGSKAI